MKTYYLTVMRGNTNWIIAKCVTSDKAIAIKRFRQMMPVLDSEGYFKSGDISFSIGEKW